VRAAPTAIAEAVCAPRFGAAHALAGAWTKPQPDRPITARGHDRDAAGLKLDTSIKDPSS
jgi:hypothetical protein